MAAALVPGSALAQTAAPRVQSEYEAGWVNDALGMRHYSGLSCPNRMGSLTRTKVMPTGRTRIAGCIYTSDQGLQVVIRQHAQDTGPTEADLFARTYLKAGFAPVRLSGVAGRGITFRTSGNADRSLLETLWHFRGRSADYTLWIAYTLPEHEMALEPAFLDVETQLARLR
ncbi:hypothetical protein GWI72_02615 [Microvirga tunisiensis]|uniref:Uncharacterized protein n=1 Tax=Pannonibacter tanglangensis TaxID=2750084 RepID=A0A7X5EZU6_9HYPH|nr:hypothetical protein [Pannonibacter sp. XCT-53]NBN77156.1 hypothetical protein [Pannonibacter sp. XCT-53]